MLVNPSSVLSSTFITLLPAWTLLLLTLLPSTFHLFSDLMWWKGQVSQCLCSGQRTTCKSQFSFLYVGPRDPTQVISLDCKQLYPLNPLSSPLNHWVLYFNKLLGMLINFLSFCFFDHKEQEVGWLPCNMPYLVALRQHFSLNWNLTFTSLAWLVSGICLSVFSFVSVPL